MVRDLRNHVAGRVMCKVEVFWDRTVGYPDVKTFCGGLPGRQVADVSRRGKFALLHLNDGGCLAIHRGMTGSVLVRSTSDTDDRFVRATLEFDGGLELRFSDVRKFGRLFWTGLEEPVHANAWIRPWEKLGPEPLSSEFTPELLAATLAKRKLAIKSALLDQKLVAGIGNIYADEALYAAGLNPSRAANSLTPIEIARLCDGIRTVLTGAIDRRGTTFSNYRDIYGSAGRNQTHLAVFHRQGGCCPRCGTQILRTTIGGRGTHFCGSCQR